MSAAVFLLCAVTSLLCAVLLLRGYAKNGARLLLWSGLCFVGLAADNAMHFVDVVVFPDVYLFDRAVRQSASLAGLTLLLYGLVWDAK
jgi:hypothetical protein